MKFEVVAEVVASVAFDVEVKSWRSAQGVATGIASRIAAEANTVPILVVPGARVLGAKVGDLRAYMAEAELDIALLGGGGEPVDGCTDTEEPGEVNQAACG